MLDIKDIKCFDGVTEFKDFYVYKLDKRATASINKVLGTTFKGVFRREDVYKNQLKSCDLNLDTGSMFLLKSCGEMVDVVAKTVPQIFFKVGEDVNRYVGGFNELYDELK